MSNIRLRFSADMPPAAVEVIGPDLSRIDRSMLRGGASHEFTAPTDSFVRIHLPDGRVEVIPDAASLTGPITPGMFSRQRTQRHGPSANTSVESKVAPPLVRRVTPGDFVGATWDDTGGVTGPTFEPQWQWRIDDTPTRIAAWRFMVRSAIPRDLVGTLGGVSIHVRIPGAADLVRVESDPSHPAGNQRVLVRTAPQEADLLAEKLRRGDIDNATTFLEKIDIATYAARIKAPYVAVMAAYLLLRLNRFDDLTVWTADFLDSFPEIPDSAVIRAWVALHRRETGGLAAARELLAELVEKEKLPVYTEGLRLYMDGLRATGQTAALEKLQSDLGLVVWTSPLTARVKVSDARGRIPAIAICFLA